MSPQTQSLIQRWIDRFGEPPVLIDEVLMQGLLDEAGSRGETQPGSMALSPLGTDGPARLRHIR